ncbi:unnamed protein product [Acanthoscelides obtectus]|uniref:Uncharacterized protein n=1 Tax=Acanthoscelides obtectus TaxID=200917 RepID=A0A9P0LZI0_ACAOB|nr:unnamed protein product [Acanthoscelides obtectus]CAK1670339.1 Envelope glycoprotein [Acanthoscelides obtectus]
MTKCQKEARIVTPAPIPNDITIEETQINILQYKEEEEIIYTSRQRFTAYCYQGTMLDPNTGCSVNDKNVPFSIEEARTSSKEGKCHTGCECGVDECHGSDAACCLDDRRTIEIGPTEYKTTRYTNGYFARHTCTSRWRCNNKKIKTKPIIIIQDGKPTRKTEAFDRHTITFDDKFYQVGAEFNNGVRYFSPLYVRERPAEIVAKARCYSSASRKIFCVFKLNGKELTTNINSESLSGTYRNLYITVLGKIKTIVNGAISYISRNEANSIYGYKISTDIQERAASISSLSEALNGLQTTQMQGIYNVIENRNLINEMMDILTKMINSLSKTNPYLLSSILGGSYKTTWLNEEVFQVCPCTEKASFPLHTNCMGNLMYKNGQVITTENSTENCFSLEESNIKNISIIKDKHDLDIEELDYLPPKTSSSEDTEWDFLVHQRTKFQEHIEHTIDEKTKGLLDYLNPFMSTKDILLYFCTCMSVLWLIEKLIFRYR